MLLYFCFCSSSSWRDASNILYSMFIKRYDIMLTHILPIITFWLKSNQKESIRLFSSSIFIAGHRISIKLAAMPHWSHPCVTEIPNIPVNPIWGVGWPVRSWWVDFSRRWWKMTQCRQNRTGRCQAGLMR